MKRTTARLVRHLGSLLAVVVLVVPVALVVPSYLRGELARANGDRSVFALPYGVPWRHYNAALAEGVLAHVPPHASVAAVGADLRTGSARWVAYVIAPRQLTNAGAQWALVFGETPQQAHLRPVRAWRYGADWLVQR